MLVTRFTGHGGGVLDPAYPVELRLLTETDLVKIFGNSFLSDFDPNNMTVPMPDETMIREAIAAAEAAAAGKPAAHLDEIVLYDLGEYFQRNFAARIEPFNRTDFWEALIQSAGRLPLAPPRPALCAAVGQDRAVHRPFPAARGRSGTDRPCPGSPCGADRADPARQVDHRRGVAD